MLALVLCAAACTIRLTPNADFMFLVGSAGAAAPGTPYRWLRNGELFDSGQVAETFLLHADGDALTAAGKAPLETTGVTFVPGRWGSTVAVEPRGLLAYPREPLDLAEGTLEMWVALRAPSDDPIYSERDHTLFQYRAANGDTVGIVQSRTAGILYAGGNVGGQWQSAYGGAASMRGWAAGEWHHLAYTWSARDNRMRFYLDGVLAADSNERRYVPPAATGERFSLGGTLSGQGAGYLIDEVRILTRPLEAAAVRAEAARSDPLQPSEVWLPLAGISPGDRLVLEVADCASAPYLYRGIPIRDPEPPSTLLPEGATALDLSVTSAEPASCSYAIGSPLAYEAMTPFESGQGQTAHQARITGLAPETTTVNHVYVRCASEPAYALHLQYRALPRVDAPFPRTGNLWGTSQVCTNGVERCARIDLFLGASLPPAQVRALRALNPNVLVLTSINTVENFGLPEDYYLHDTEGNRIEVWPGTYRLNLTKPYVAEYQARYAYQRVLDTGLMVDGCFFDNFFTNQSWLKADIHGRAVQLDADEDGKPDDPAWLDAAWKRGVYLELKTWRKLMPWALASGHLPRPPQPEFASIFNGDSIGFMTTDAIERKRPFQDLWDTYHGWWVMGRAPVITMVESSPPDQISYGYDYDPLKKIPPATLEFARTYYPYVRFGLAFTLMGDGFFAHEFGDTWHGNDWWYDELDFNLGYPLGPAARQAVDRFTPAEHLVNGGFEEPLEGNWRLTVNAAAGASAALARDTADAVEGSASARVTIASAGQGVDWHVDFNQPNRSLVKGVRYDLSFWAKADTARSISLSSQKGSPDWRNYGLSRRLAIAAEWRKYVVTFEARETVDDARIQFFLGAQTGVVWFDSVSFEEHPPDVWRRDFTNGVALLNGTRERQTIQVGPGFRRLTGEQAPRHEYILDDGGAGFSAAPEWRAATYESGEWKAAGPFYHDWGEGCHQLDGGGGPAQWDLELREDDTYTVEAWWPAAPQSSTWSRRVVFELISGGEVVASATVDQSTGGDRWHELFTAPLSMAGAPFVRVHNEGSGPAIADALHVRSAARYNDGSQAEAVTLEPMDGIVLQRDPQ